MRARFRTFLLAALAASLCAPAGAAAQATPEFIDGSPLNVYADGRGRFQVYFDGSGAGVFNPPDSRAPNAGFNLALYKHTTPNQGQAGPVFGFLGPGSPSHPSSGEFTPGAPPDVIPQNDGSVELRSTYSTPTVPDYTPSAGTLLVTERLFYRNGEASVRARYQVQNQATGGVALFRASVVGDTFHLATTTGGGFFSAGPPQSVGTFNHAAGDASALTEGTPSWGGWEAGDAANLFGKVRSPAGAGFDRSILAGPLDDAAGAQWDTHRTNAIPPVTTTAFELTWRFSRYGAIAIDPTSAAPTAPGTQTINVAIQGGAVPVAGQSIRYSVSGANPQGGTATTDGAGGATFQVDGAEPGQDTVDVFWDANGNGTHDVHEAVAQATIGWQEPPLRRGRTLRAGLVEGTVLIAERTPSPRAAGGAHAAQLTPFRPLTGSEQIPVGSVIDTRKGTVRLTTARDRLGTRLQKGNFKGSRFQVRQSTESALTELRMRGGNFARCSRDFSRGAAHAAARRIRRLRGSSRGRFRTRGRRSSATVRGTRWIQEDQCRGTLTIVRAGSVRVRDFAKRRTIVLRAGRQYLARSRRR